MPMTGHSHISLSVRKSDMAVVSGTLCLRTNGLVVKIHHSRSRTMVKNVLDNRARRGGTQSELIPFRKALEYDRHRDLTLTSLCSWPTWYVLRAHFGDRAQRKRG